MNTFLFSRAGKAPGLLITMASLMVASLLVGEVLAQNVVINEIHADPASGSAGDANGDGTRSSSQDEFVELVNVGGSAVDLSGWQISDAVKVRHTFAAGTTLDPGKFVVVFGGGSPTGIPGQVVTASEGSLGLNNGGDTVTLLDDGGNTQDAHTYGSEGGDDQSLTRDPDGTGDFVKHTEAPGAGGARFSPGTTVDGQTMLPAPDETPPECSAGDLQPGPPVFREITARDVESGLAEINVLQATHAEVSIPSFPAGTTAPVVITASRTADEVSASVQLQLVDVAGNQTTCAFDLQVPVQIDIDPNQCPNPLNVHVPTILPVAILGTADFKVQNIDPATVTLEGQTGMRHRREDVATPPDGAWDCGTPGGDGHQDLHVHFNTDGFIQGLSHHANGAEVALTLRGRLQDGIPFEGRDCVLIRSRNLSKSGQTTSVDPSTVQLLDARPNPFNPETVIRFYLPEETRVRLTVWNLLGQKVRTLLAGQAPPGEHRVRWDGTNDAGEPVGSGIYVYRLEAAEVVSSRAMTLIR